MEQKISFPSQLLIYSSAGLSIESKIVPVVWSASLGAIAHRGEIGAR